jgi:hypothetical protein
MRIPVLSAIVAGLLTGCQCCSLSEPYADLIDNVSDQKLTLDALYNPELDLQRIGKPDWCRSPLNRWLCRGRDCCSGGQGGYDPHCGWPQGAAAHPSRPAELPLVPAAESKPDESQIPPEPSAPEPSAPATLQPAPPAAPAIQSHSP